MEEEKEEEERIKEDAMAIQVKSKSHCHVRLSSSLKRGGACTGAEGGSAGVGGGVEGGAGVGGSEAGGGVVTEGPWKAGCRGSGVTAIGEGPSAGGGGVAVVSFFPLLLLVFMPRGVLGPLASCA